MFTVKFDFDFDEYKKNVKTYKLNHTKPYHFSELARSQIRDACALLGIIAQQVVLRSPARDSLLREYFGTDTDATLMNNLKRMNDVINGDDNAVTFVDGTDRHVAVKVDPQNLDNPQKLMDTPYGDAVMKNAGAWVHTLPGTGAPRKPGEYHVGSGYRIILGRAWSRCATDIYERAGVIFHELTHKVLGTNDHVYGKTKCKGLVTNKEIAKTMKNADNYNYFVEELAKNLRPNA